MVEVVYHRDDTFLSMSPHEEQQQEEGRVPDSSMSSQRTYDMGRDTSHTNRCSGDDTRQSVHNSILNCTGETEDEDDDIVEPGSFLFDDEDFHSPLNRSLEHDVAIAASSPASPREKALFCGNDRWLNTSLQNVTDSFVSLCSSRQDEACGGFTDFVNVTETCSRQLQHQVEFDLLQLLGCNVPNAASASAATFGGDVTWFSPLLIKAPSSAAMRPVVRRNPRQRAERIRRMRNELLGEASHVITPSRSVDDHPLDRFIGGGIDPIERQEEEGYDSDPGEVLFQEQPRNDSLRDTSLLDEEENEEEYHFYDGHRTRIAEEYNMRMQHRGPRDEHDREVYEAVQVRTLVFHVCLLLPCPSLHDSHPVAPLYYLGCNEFYLDTHLACGRESHAIVHSLLD